VLVKPEQIVRRKFNALKGAMDERMRRLWAGAEAEAIGHGGIAAVSRATKMAISTVQKGRNELRAGADGVDLVSVRRKGGGRPPRDEVHPELMPALQKLVDPATRGDPMSPLRWTCKSAVNLSRAMFDTHGIRVSDKTIGKVLRKMGYSLQAAQKTVEGAQHPDRNAQFEHINATAEDCLGQGVPFISVDTKKKELVGNFKNAGLEWQPKDTPELNLIGNTTNRGGLCRASRARPSPLSNRQESHGAADARTRPRQAPLPRRLELYDPTSTQVRLRKSTCSPEGP
jgi:hypothetical protein